jgi:hypothetical protein
MSTGIEAIVVTSPENMLAKKWQNIPSLTYSVKVSKFLPSAKKPRGKI